MVLTESEFERSEARALKKRDAGHAQSARYDRRRHRVVVQLSTGVEIAFPAELAEGLADASPEDLGNIEISPTGLGLHWPRLDADLYIPALLQGILGSRTWMASRLGSVGGKVRSAAKAAAARENGRKGGRPRSQPNLAPKQVSSASMQEADTIAREVRQLFDLHGLNLGDEFYPAHLSVALIDAILTPRLRYEKQVVPIIERYCQHFGLSRIRPDRQHLPSATDQETLGELVNHYMEYGIARMESEVFVARYCSPGTPISKVENIHRAAIALRQIGLENLQDLEAVGPKQIICALQPLKGIGYRTINMFLMYVGNENYVKGDIHIRRFVADTLDTQSVRADDAEQIVRDAAQILDIAPRNLDYAIWKYGAHTRR